MEMKKERLFDTIQTYRKAGEALDFLMKVGPALEENAQAPSQERQGRRRVREAA
ncbi:hypothetical protein [Enterobacter asburiae]|uniref:hypothetical protein n=1 Tax=Enterobacter asburiae TaxID=61645 RepID=UPI001F0CBFEA|nr:hypothetical protein [Enterobacter asburiae]ELC7204888.1 hypothetical protein [Enterobacter hormaechei]MCH4306610.1 hypothetical protein [Enterobacter asburiae]